METNRFNLPSKELFFISIRLFLLKKFFIFTILFGICIFLYFINITYFIFILIGTLLAIAFVLFNQLRFVYNKKNAIYQKNRHCIIDNNAIETIYEDGSKSTFNISDIISITKTKKYFLLFISQANYIYIPMQSFKNVEDRNAFYEIVKSNSDKNSA